MVKGFHIAVSSRLEAMRLFEADCPRQLVTEMGLDQRRRRAEQVKLFVSLLSFQG